MTESPDPGLDMLRWRLLELAVHAGWNPDICLEFARRAEHFITDGGQPIVIDRKLATDLNEALNALNAPLLSPPTPEEIAAAEDESHSPSAETPADAAGEAVRPPGPLPAATEIPAGPIEVTRKQMNTLEALVEMLPSGRGTVIISELREKSGETSAYIWLQDLVGLGVCGREGRFGAPTYVIKRKPAELKVRKLHPRGVSIAALRPPAPADVKANRKAAAAFPADASPVPPPPFEGAAHFEQKLKRRCNLCPTIFETDQVAVQTCPTCRGLVR